MWLSPLGNPFLLAFLTAAAPHKFACEFCSSCLFAISESPVPPSLLGLGGTKVSRVTYPEKNA